MKKLDYVLVDIDGKNTLNITIRNSNVLEEVEKKVKRSEWDNIVSRSLHRRGTIVVCMESERVMN